MSFDQLKCTRARWRVSSDEAFNESLDTRVTKGEDFLPGGEDDDGNLGTAKGAELASFLEEAGATLGEGDLEVALIRHLDHLNLLPASTLPHGWRNGEKIERK